VPEASATGRSRVRPSTAAFKGVEPDPQVDRRHQAPAGIPFAPRPGASYRRASSPTGAPSRRAKKYVVPYGEDARGGRGKNSASTVLSAAIWGIEKPLRPRAGGKERDRSLAYASRKRATATIFSQRLVAALVILHGAMRAKIAGLLGGRDGSAAIHSLELSCATPSIFPAAARADMDQRLGRARLPSPIISAKAAGGRMPWVPK